jgi:tellurite resistance protein
VDPVGAQPQVFSDAEADAAEREELRAYLASGVLAEADIADTLDDFAKTTWTVTMADGVASETEKKRLGEIVDVLGLAPATLPSEWAELLD